ncbi:MAG: TIR domain-containing protein [Anaerolineae bacterium]|nr:TIR domain-containing protein [Anaerolineae bacterium]
MTLKVFISYKSEYRDFARAVKGELNQWGFDTWLDVDNIQPGDYFRHKIQEGLDSSDVLLMVLTEEAQLSHEVMSEVDYFLDVAKKPVVPLRHRECKPLYIFVSIQYIDFVTDQANGFVQLKQRLSELSSSIQPVPPAIEEITLPLQKPGAAALADFLSEVDLDAKDKASREQSASGVSGGLVNAPEPVEKERAEPTPEKAASQDTQKKQDILNDGLFDLAPMEPALSSEPPKPQPAPPQSTEQQAPSGFPAAQPATPVLQPSRQTQTMPESIEVGRERSSPILWPLAAVASLVIIVGAAVLYSSNAGPTTATQQPQGTSPLIWVGIIALLGVVGVFGWRWFGRSQSAAIPDAQTDAKNRATMLQNVEDFWLKGVLDPALEAGTLDIGLSSAPGAVLRHKDYGDYALSPNANILDVFNDLNRELLILGAPGGGKTVLLLQLAQELIVQAKNPHPSIPSPSGRGEEPMPVVFNLSSWTAERKPLADWLVDELKQKYQVPKKVASAWVEGEKLLLLLDGLDEVAEEYRNDCVDAINGFRQQYRTVDLALCSRSEEYDALTSKLDVRGAIVLEPLSWHIIVAYLDRPELANLRQVIATDVELREMSHVPFLLNAMAYAYAGATPTNLQFPISADPVKARRTHLFDRWVEKRLAAKPIDQYETGKVRKWLGWLAVNMVKFEKIVFYIEELQPKWLSVNRLLYFTAIVLTSGLVSAAAFGLAFGLILGPYFGLTGVLVFGLALGLMFGLVFGTTQIKLAERLTWRFSWFGVTVGLALGVAIAMILGLTVGIEYLRTYGLESGMVGGLIGTLTGALAGGLQAGESVTSRSRPNQGIKQSAYNTLRVIPMFGLGFAIVFGPVFGLLGGLLGWLTFGIAFGVAFGLAAGLAFGGGFAVLKHLILRFIFWRLDNEPWNYARFLDYCSSAGLMRKLGGGYIFAHRYLMEYFAEGAEEQK